MRRHGWFLASLAVLVAATGCKDKMDAAKSSAAGAGSEFHLIVEEGRLEPECVSSVVFDTTFDPALAEDVSAICGDFSPPGALVSLRNEHLVRTLGEELASRCEVESRVVEGDVDWSLRVVEEGVSTDCMTNELKEMVPGTGSADWRGRVSAGQVVHTSTDHRTIREVKRRLEHKCGCVLVKEVSR
jgi:hypothetical protein